MNGRRKDMGMKLLVRENKILLIIMVLALVASLAVIMQRTGIEKEYKSYDIVLDYNEIEAMAEQSDHDVVWWLEKFKAMGITKVGLAEESLVTLMEGTDLPVSGTIMNDIMKDADWENAYPQEVVDKLKERGIDKYDVLIEVADEELFIFLATAVNERYQPDQFAILAQGEGGYILLDGTPRETLFTEKFKYKNSIRKDFVEKEEIASSKLIYLNFGMLPSKVETLQNLGMEIIPRTSSYNGWNDTKYAKAVLADYDRLQVDTSYVIVGGEAVIGYDDGIEVAKDYITENGIAMGLIEHTTQLQNILQDGVNEIVTTNNYHAVRIFTVWDYIQNRYQYYGYEGAKEIENTLFRAVAERNVRVIYFKPIKEFKDQHIYVTDPEEYETLFQNLDQRLAKHNIQLSKTASPMADYQVSKLLKLIMALGCVAAAVLLLRTILPIGKRLKAGIFILGAAGVLGAYFVMPGYAELLTAFAAAVIFPCLSTLFIVKQSKEFADTLPKEESLGKILGLGILTLFIAVAISLLGGMMTAAPISSAGYMLEIDIFRGVKLAQLLPLAFFPIAYLAYYGYGHRKETPGRLEFNDLQDLLNASIKVWMVMLGVVLAGVGAYYMIRTGHDSSIEVSSMEMLFRNSLEDHLMARPRNKEFLFAFPSIMMLAYTSIRKFKLWPIIFGLASVIGLTSVVNTFMHIRTPLYLGFVRTGYSLLFGVVIGIIAILIFEVAYKLFKRLERQIG